MKKFTGSCSILAAGLALFSSAAVSEFSLFEHALPVDEGTKIVRLVDGFNPNDAGTHLLLTNNTGYEIRCNSTSGLSAIFQGLGYDLNLLPLMETMTLDDPIVFDSNYQSNPVLNCEPGANHTLYVVQYPEDHEDPVEYIDGLRYFIHFGESNALNMIGCQGLIDALGFNIDDATPMSYDVAHSFFVDVDDKHDIHCIDGVVAGPRNCGEYADGSTWLEAIDNGEQAYICNSGVAEKDGAPICHVNYKAEGERCVYVPRACGSHPHGAIWTGTIPNGSQNYSCQDGVIKPVGHPVCNEGFTAMDGQCVYVPKSCGSYTHDTKWNQAIVGGTQTWKCDDGVSVFQSVVCDAGYRQKDQLCEYVFKSCGSHPHNSSWMVNITGGKQTWRCDDGTSEFVSVSCETQYVQNGRECKYVSKDCDGRVHGSSWLVNITGGKQTWQCNDGNSFFVEVNCDAHYIRNGQGCDYVPKKCGNHAHNSQWNTNIDGGTQTWRCNDGNRQFVDVTCNTNYTVNGQICQYVPRNCGAHAHNSTWTSITTESERFWCVPPQYQDEFRCDDGRTHRINRVTLFEGIPRYQGRPCQRGDRNR